MAQGLIPGRGPWTYRTYDVLSTATFKKGCAVRLNVDRVVSEYSGGSPGFLGIAMHDSANSLPPGKVVVAIPGDYGCTVQADLDAVAASGLSIGQSGAIIKKGNFMSYFSSAGSTVASGQPLIICSPLNSALSTIECTLNVAALTSVTSLIPV
jgi:hypothetical protein